MGLLLAVAGVVVGLASLVFAIKTQQEKAKFERLVNCELAGIAGSILMIRDNPRLAHSNIDYILQRLEDLEGSPNVKEIVNHLAWAQGDSAATHRLLEVLLNNVLGLQEGLFGTRRVSRYDSLPELNPGAAAHVMSRQDGESPTVR